MKIEWIEKYLKEAEQMIFNDDVDQGLKLMSALLYDEPGYGSLHNHLGWAYMYYTDEDERAELHLRMAIKFNPELPAPYLHLGQLLIRLKRYAEAVAILEVGSTKPEANLGVVWHLIGRAHELTSEYRKAIVAYRQAMVSTAGYDFDYLSEGIKRCKKKKRAKKRSL